MKNNVQVRTVILKRFNGSLNCRYLAIGKSNTVLVAFYLSPQKFITIQHLATRSFGVLPYMQQHLNNLNSFDEEIVTYFSVDTYRLDGQFLLFSGE